MEWITRWRKRLGVLLRREEVERELEEEFAFHLEMETRNNLRAGMTPEAARRRAVLTFGGRERFREEVRDARWFAPVIGLTRSEEHTSELQSRQYLVCRLLLEKKTAS